MLFAVNAFIRVISTGNWSSFSNSILMAQADLQPIVKLCNIIFETKVKLLSWLPLLDSWLPIIQSAAGGPT
jgi:hypothetical protein